jgi:hypothetical protein
MGSGASDANAAASRRWNVSRSESSSTGGNAEQSVASKPPAVTSQKTHGQTAYLPKTINGAVVLVEEQKGKWRATKEDIVVDCDGLAYRASKDYQDKLGMLCLPWGTCVDGIDEGDGWIRLHNDKASDAPKYPVLDLTFLDPSAGEVTVRFHRRPLGCRIIMHELPIRVDSINESGAAAQLGVQKGWILVKVNDNIIAGSNFDEQFSFLKSGMKVLPAEPARTSLEIVFEADSDGRRETVVFSKKPLGLTFQHRKPVVVKSLREDCVATRHGVQVGWVIVQVDGKDLTDMNFPDQLDLMTTTISSLPEMTYSVAPPLFAAPVFASQSVASTTPTDVPPPLRPADADECPDGRL